MSRLVVWVLALAVGVLLGETATGADSDKDRGGILIDKDKGTVTIPAKVAPRKIDDPRYKDYWSLYHHLAGRGGVTPDTARTIVRSNTTVIAALALQRGDADAMICGLEGAYMRHLRYVRQIIGLAPGVRDEAHVVAGLLAPDRDHLRHDAREVRLHGAAPQRPRGALLEQVQDHYLEASHQALARRSTTFCMTSSP